MMKTFVEECLVYMGWYSFFE